jgi:hypothetical protein
VNPSIFSIISIPAFFASGCTSVEPFFVYWKEDEYQFSYKEDFRYHCNMKEQTNHQISLITVAVTAAIVTSVIVLGITGIIFVAIKPVAASDNHDDDFSNIVYRIDHISGVVDKVIHFDSLADCHDYVEHHLQLQLSINDCIID